MTVSNLEAVNDPTVTRVEVGREAELEAALEAIRDGNVPRPVGNCWFPDGRPSKHDQCIHNVWMYQTCDGCLDAFIDAALAQGPSS